MTESWKQFSLYPPGCRNKFQPQQVLHTFLPKWLASVKLRVWHIFFEPSALIRFQADDFEDALRQAVGIAVGVGLVMELGDCSSSLNPDLTYQGEDYGGEARTEAYGPQLWAAAVKFFQASSELSLVVQTLDAEKQLAATRRFLHVYLNTLGLNYLEEATVSRLHAERSEELVKKYYRL